MAAGFFLPFRFKIGSVPVAIQAGFVSLLAFWFGGIASAGGAPVVVSSIIPWLKRRRRP